MEDIKKLRNKIVHGQIEDFNGEELGRISLAFRALEISKETLNHEEKRILDYITYKEEFTEKDFSMFEPFRYIGVFITFIYKDINMLYFKSQSYYYKIAYLLKQWENAEYLYNTFSDNKIKTDYFENKESNLYYYISENFKKNYLFTLKNSIKDYSETLKHISTLKMVVNFWARYYKVPTLKKIIDIPLNTDRQIKLVNNSLENITNKLKRTNLFIGEENAEQLKEYFLKELPSIRPNQTKINRKDSEQFREILKETKNFYIINPENFLYSLEQLKNIMFNWGGFSISRGAE